MNVAGSFGLARCREVMRDLREDPDVARSVFMGLPESEMDALGLRTFRMNLYAVFGGVLPIAQIDRIAVDALRLKLWLGWEHHSRIERMTADGGELGVANLPIDLIERLRGSGGVVLASFQFGAIREIFAGLAISGIPVTFALARSVHDEYCRSRASNPGAAMWRFADVADAESLEGVSKLGRALDRGETILVCLDGNTGLGGAHDLKGRLRIGFLGQNAHVKMGAARIAARHGAPMLPLLAPVGRRGARCHRVGALLDPGARLSGPEAREFAAGATTEIYGRFERHVRRAPAQWGVVESFHRWREPQPSGEVVTAAEVAERLDSGMRVGLRPGSIVVSAVRNAEALVTNVRSMRSVRIPERLIPTLHELAHGALDREAVERADRVGERSTGALLAALGALGVVSFGNAGGSHAVA